MTRMIGFDPAHGKDKSVIVEMAENRDGTITLVSSHVSHFVGYGYIVDEDETRAQKIAGALVQVYDNAPDGQKRVYFKKYGHYWKGPIFVKTEHVELTA